ncbi:YhcH/YjgK/YiaL family protein [Paenibacillus sabinae]|uniref:YhcH/YjgK/YiaL family protein n=1 Tax=Paenibacillus sabinae T27 TaxID=1268072 RepID=X4ZJW1_9BACL|nr:YhcH/YjgK/YiaL family protein [Paenibacillus sabinae]AHV96985.1 hypothetical protein PSAB_10275 [Paenibacillus sabinae T27]
MYFGSIETLEQTKRQYPPAIARALQYLKDNREQFLSMDAGVYPIEGQQIYAQVVNLETKKKEDTRPEVHRKYIDVQFSVEGNERIGFAADTGNNAVDEDLAAEKDIIFYKQAENEMELLMQPGQFAVFFPEDVHRPGCQNKSQAHLRKVIVKVSTEAL